MILFKAFGASLFLWISIASSAYGIIQHEVFWIAVAIYFKIASTEKAYQLGWFTQDSLAVPIETESKTLNLVITVEEADTLILLLDESIPSAKSRQEQEDRCALIGRMQRLTAYLRHARVI